MAQDIDTIIKDSRTAASNFASIANAALNGAQGAAGAIQTAVSGNLNFQQDAAINFQGGNAPTLEDRFTLPFDNSARPTLNAINLPEPPSYPNPVSINIDGLFGQSVPDFDTRGFGESAPVLNTDGLFAGLEAPVLNTFEAPAVSDVDVGDAPELNIPEFTSNFVDPNIAAPTAWDSAYQTDYDTVLPEMRGFIEDNLSSWMATYAPDYQSNLAELQAKVSTDMQSGQALSDEFETSLYNRARARVEGERIRTERTALQGISKRGFSLPSAILSASLQDSQQAAANNIATQSTELAIERAKIEIQHVQFVMQISQGLTQVLVGASLSYAGVLATVNGQALEHSKQLATILSDIYGNLVSRGNLSIDVHRAEAQIYETQLKSSLAALDGFKLELDAARLEKDIDGVNVDIYSKQIQAEGLKIQQYVSNIQATSEKASLEKLKIDLYGEQVNAYAAEVKTQEYALSAYVASLNGDESRVKGEIAKLSAYTAEVEAVNAKLGADVEYMKASDSHNRSIQDIYSTELGIYKTAVDAESSRFAGSVEANKAALFAYTSDNEANLNTYKISYDKSRLDLQAAEKSFEADLKVEIENASNILKSANIQADTSVAAGRVYGTMAASALSSLNTMASKSATE